MKSDFSRPITFHSWTSSTVRSLSETSKRTAYMQVLFDLSERERTVTGPRKKLQRPKLKKRHPENGIFTPWFLGFTTIIINFSFFIWHFYEQISKKKLAEMYHGDYRISQSGRFWWPLFDSNFHTVNVIFGWNQLYQRNFTSFGNEMSKNFFNYLWRFWYTKETLSPGQRIFFVLNFI